MTTQWTAERRAIFQLATTEGLGPIKLRRLLDAFGSATAVLRASANELTQIVGVGPKIVDALRDSSRLDESARAVEAIERSSIRVLFEDDDEYPAPLREIYDNPVFLTIKGTLLPTDRAAIAIVGSRRCTRYGIEQAERFATFLAGRGVTIISGLARGIDGAAHRAALAAGGRTIAVLASGLANIYPPEHADLADEVAEHGAVVSEAPIGGAPLAGLFPQRNRIISGLSLGVLVVEAAERSGALSTAHHAVEQNRDVFALPGRVTDPASQGTNRIIRQGATLVTHPEEILEQLGPIEAPGSASSAGAPATLFDDAAAPELGEMERKIWESLAGDAVPIDVVVERTGADASIVAASLLTMELGRHVERLPGSLFRRRARS